MKSRSSPSTCSRRSTLLGCPDALHRWCLAWPINFGLAFYKSQVAAGTALPLKGTVLITVATRDKQAVLPAAKNWRRWASRSWRRMALSLPERSMACEAQLVKAVRPTKLLDLLQNGEITCAINTRRARKP